MTTTPEAAKPAAFSIADLKAKVATEEIVKFEPLLPDGVTPSGVTFDLKSDLAPSVDARLKELIDQNTRKEQLRGAQAAKSRPGEIITPVDETATLARRMVAARIAGWTLSDEFTEANALTVLQYWVGLGDQILAKTADLARFTPTSPKA